MFCLDFFILFFFFSFDNLPFMGFPGGFTNSDVVFEFSGIVVALTCVGCHLLYLESFWLTFALTNSSCDVLFFSFDNSCSFLACYYLSLLFYFRF